MYEHVRETLDDDQEQALENDEKQQRDVSIQEEQLDLKEKKNRILQVQKKAQLKYQLLLN